VSRAHRLYAITEALRAAGAGGRTASSLADRFEVSVRTIKRDMRALVDAGARIVAQEGRGGGYQLSRDAPLPPLSFTAAEATAVALALAAEPDMPFRKDGNAALAKLLGAMSPSARAHAEDTAARLWMRAAHLKRPRCARVLDDALERQVAVSLVYRDARGKETTRRIDPMAFARTHGHWHVLAWCHARGAGRWFRLDRIVRATLTKVRAPKRVLRDVFGDPPQDAHPLDLRPR
jgi:predicted DNA-binding transcriptional regulator YafY